MNENHVDTRLVFQLDDDSDSDQEQRNDRKTTTVSVSNLSIRRSPSSSNEIRTLKDKFIDCLKQLYIRLGMKHVIPFFILVLYSVAGGAAFYYIESTDEADRIVQRGELLQYARRQVQERVWELHVENFSRSRILEYAAEALEWFENYTSLNTQPDIQWDLWGAIFYSGTIYTTIGYGNIAPVTIAGRILTMIYSAVGIPLILFILNDMGEVIGKAAYKLWSFIKKNTKHDDQRKLHQIKVKRNASFNDAGSVSGIDATSTVHKLPMSVAFGITLGWMLTCSAIFSLWENWDYFTAFYFFFISLTTIGLGDVVPRHHQFLMMNFGLVLLGLSLVSMCIKVVQAKVEHIAQLLLHRISKRYQNALSDGESLNTVPAEELENTLNQLQQPSWLKVLLSRKKKAKIISEYKKRAKMRAKSSQTDVNTYSTGVQTDDTVDWRKHYEKELVNVQQLVQQLEQMYDYKEKRQSLRKLSASTNLDEGNLDAADNEQPKRKLSFKESFKRFSTDITASSSSSKAAATSKSMKLANYVRQVFKSPRKRAAVTTVAGVVDNTCSPSLNKNVIITFNDGETSEPTIFSDKDVQEDTTRDILHETISDPVLLDTDEPTETKDLSRQMTLHLPSVHLEKRDPLSQIERLSRIHKRASLCVDSKDGRILASGTTNKSALRQRGISVHQLQPKNSLKQEDVINKNQITYNTASGENITEINQSYGENISNNNFSSQNDDDEKPSFDKAIESFFVNNKKQQFDFVDDSLSVYETVPRNDVPEIHKTRRETTKLEVQKHPRSHFRRLSLSTDQEDDNSSFPRVPYALDDCKLLFAEIKHKINDCQHILSEQRLGSTVNTPIHAFTKSLSDRPLALRHSRHGFGGGDLLRREISPQSFNGRR